MGRRNVQRRKNRRKRRPTENGRIARVLSALSLSPSLSFYTAESTNNMYCVVAPNNGKSSATRTTSKWKKNIILTRLFYFIPFCLIFVCVGYIYLFISFSHLASLPLSLTHTLASTERETIWSRALHFISALCPGLLAHFVLRWSATKIDWIAASISSWLCSPEISFIHTSRTPSSSLRSTWFPFSMRLFLSSFYFCFVVAPFCTFFFFFTVVCNLLVYSIVAITSDGLRSDDATELWPKWKWMYKRKADEEKIKWKTLLVMNLFCSIFSLSFFYVCCSQRCAWNSQHFDCRQTHLTLLSMLHCSEPSFPTFATCMAVWQKFAHEKI